MAVRPITKKYTFDSTGTVLLSAILDRPANTWMGSLAVRSARENAEDVYWSDAQGVAGGYIGPAEAVTFDFGEGQSLVGRFSLQGKSGDAVYLTIGLSSAYFGPDDY